MGRTVRVIRRFDKKTEKLVGEEEIKDFDLAFFKKLFNHTSTWDTEMVDGWDEITELHLPYIQPFIKHKIDLRKYDYFCGAYEESD